MADDTSQYETSTFQPIGQASVSRKISCSSRPEDTRRHRNNAKYGRLRQPRRGSGWKRTAKEAAETLCISELCSANCQGGLPIHRVVLPRRWHLWLCLIILQLDMKASRAILGEPAACLQHQLYTAPSAGLLIHRLCGPCWLILIVAGSSRNHEHQCGSFRLLRQI